MPVFISFPPNSTLQEISDISVATLSVCSFPGIQCRSFSLFELSIAANVCYQIDVSACHIFYIYHFAKSIFQRSVIILQLQLTINFALCKNYHYFIVIVCYVSPQKNAHLRKSRIYGRSLNSLNWINCFYIVN